MTLSARNYKEPMSIKPLSHGQVAKLLRTLKIQIIEEWEKRCRERVEPARRNDPLSVRDSLPQFLEQMASILECLDSSQKREGLANVAAEHGEDRASLRNYHLGQVIFEFRLLREVLIQVLNSEGPITPDSLQMVHSFIDEGISNAAVRFSDIKKKETQQTLDELTRMQVEAETERTRLSEFFVQSPVPMVILMGPEHRFVLANKPYEKMIGRKATHKTVQEVFSMDEVRNFIPLLDNVYRTGEPFTGRALPMTIKDAKGVPNQYYFNFIYYPFRAPSGEIQGVMAIVQDVTLETTVRNKIEESETQVREIANAMPQIVWTARPNGFVDWFNDRYYTYTGSSRESHWDAPGSPLHSEDFPRVEKCWAEALRTGQPYEVEHRFRRASDGQYRWFIARGLPIRDQDGTITKWVGTNTEIHDQKMLQQQLEEQREVRERFVATLSHDLRTPLTSVKIAAQLLQGKLQDPETVRSLSDRIVTNIDRADRMIRDLLDSNRIKAGEPLPLSLEKCRLDQLVQKVIYELKEIHGPRFEMNNEIGAIEGCWDCSGLQRILENLGTNAIKYGSSEKLITFLLKKAQDWAEVSVHNFGSPISPEDQKTLFQPYHRTQSALLGGQKGWGIGLVLVRGIAEAHGGSVRVESESEIGTTFTIRLPLR